MLLSDQKIRRQISTYRSLGDMNLHLEIAYPTLSYHPGTRRLFRHFDSLSDGRDLFRRSDFGPEAHVMGGRSFGSFDYMYLSDRRLTLCASLRTPNCPICP